jgi:hypothetical protein
MVRVFFFGFQANKLPKWRILWYSEASCVELLKGEQAKTDIVGSLSCFGTYKLIV